MSIDSSEGSPVLTPQTEVKRFKFPPPPSSFPETPAIYEIASLPEQFTAWIVTGKGLLENDKLRKEASRAWATAFASGVEAQRNNPIYRIPEGDEAREKILEEELNCDSARVVYFTLRKKQPAEPSPQPTKPETGPTPNDEMIGIAWTLSYDNLKKINSEKAEQLRNFFPADIFDPHKIVYISMLGVVRQSLDGTNCSGLGLGKKMAAASVSLHPGKQTALRTINVAAKQLYGELGFQDYQTVNDETLNVPRSFLGMPQTNETKPTIFVSSPLKGQKRRLGSWRS
ncbi:hypothetical protein A2160_01070 [Candidatus Beckwithbacteria bacterium RBG_13_42_9]|uniref:N-acetyltransferase domain-containing protein n=1 Tax=Candidatus Beckwithbacteria bacterium RBG_13_42_9 TaxID=1797457 RepID=A0A1F5E3I5_9BACT|nr:MAG: hypothetical protein A2160_01070 [Candidatus Beckwithbacteria bacterium RBG_13_42_9]